MTAQADMMEKLNENLFLWINNAFASPLMDGAMTFVTVTGDATVVIGLGLMSLFWRGAPWRTAVIFLAAMAAGGASVHVIKQSLPKDRPLAHFEERIHSGDVTVRTPFMALRHRTFPSGHTQAAFTAAVFFSLLIWRPGPAAALLVWAAMVGLSRIYLGVHFPMDVAGGAMVGAFCGWLIFRLGFGRTGGPSAKDGAPAAAGLNQVIS